MLSVLFYMPCNTNNFQVPHLGNLWKWNSFHSVPLRGLRNGGLKLKLYTLWCHGKWSSTTKRNFSLNGYVFSECNEPSASVNKSGNAGTYTNKPAPARTTARTATTSPDAELGANATEYYIPRRIVYQRPTVRRTHETLGINKQNKKYGFFFKTMGRQSGDELKKETMVAYKHWLFQLSMFAVDHKDIKMWFHCIPSSCEQRHQNWNNQVVGGTGMGRSASGNGVECQTANYLQIHC